MREHDCRGCGEYNRLSRRRFLGLAGGAAALAAAPGWLPRVVLADADDSDRDVLVSIFLRGGCDGLSLCVPFGESAYYGLRPDLAVPPPDSSAAGRALDLDGFFGLPPAMAPLLEAYHDQQLAIVHACGLDNPTRSHFDAMRFIETGMGDAPASLATGWLGRHLAATAPSASQGLLRAVAIGYALPRLMVGAPRALPIPEPGDYGLAGDPASEAARREALAAMYAGLPDPLAAAATGTLATVDLLETIDFAGYRPAGGAVYPEDELGHGLRSTAALIKAEVGVEAVALDLGGWDTHEHQGPIDGEMSRVMASLAGGLAAFWRDLAGDGFTRVTAIAMSEFGRNARQNGSGGTDHGHGGVMLALGGAVEGGRVVSDWPGLEDGELYDGQDLAVTIDYRDVLTEVLTERLGNPDFRTVFDDPSFVPTDRGVVR